MNRFLITLTLLLHLSYLSGQTPPGDCPCDPDDPAYDACAAANPDCDPVASIPINQHMGWLIGAGLMLGLFYSSRQHKKEAVNA